MPIIFQPARKIRNIKPRGLPHEGQSPAAPHLFMRFGRCIRNIQEPVEAPRSQLTCTATSRRRARHEVDPDRGGGSTQERSNYSLVAAVYTSVLDQGDIKEMAKTETSSWRRSLSRLTMFAVSSTQDNSTHARSSLMVPERPAASSHSGPTRVSESTIRIAHDSVLDLSSSWGMSRSSTTDFMMAAACSLQIGCIPPPEACSTRERRLLAAQQTGPKFGPSSQRMDFQDG